ncbi:ABC transporter transmembrane domain-containing protein [Ningiella sp. W23]|uniref:ABC transporter transmembrane domain-containing protein n=1 Tax=Ningiella sp. W23 TaxID=3023715 RepID=UPI003756B1CE
MAQYSKNDINRARQLVKELIYPERDFIRLAIVYGLAISLLTLAIPIAVQTLINTVVNIASVSAVITLSVLLFITLGLSGVLSALRTYVMEKYERHIYARLTAEISVRTLLTEHQFFSGRRNVDIPNRYFDINIFQKNLPPLLIDGFALFLQLLVGFALVSLYHPVFMAFCIALVLVLYLIWSLWARRAIGAAIELSHAKYGTAKWLGDMAAARSLFTSQRHIEYVQARTDANTAEYISCHKTYFRYAFAQVIAFLLLYALASSLLLGMGGYLVILGELSIGQLVAAELILTAIFFGLSKAGNYLKMYYEMCGAADELGLVLNMPINEKMTLEHDKAPTHNALDFHQLFLKQDDVSYFFDFTIASGAKTFVFTTQAWLQREIVSVLKYYQIPEKGRIRLGEFDLSEFRDQQLNHPPVSVINKAPIVESTILEFMTLSAPNKTVADIQDALFRVGLEDVVTQLKDGLNTTLSQLGSPLQPHEFLLLKLASALLYAPNVLVLTQYFDNLPRKQLVRLLSTLEEESFTVLYFTNHPEIEAFDYCLNLDWQKVT